TLDWVAGLLGLGLAPATLLGVVRTLGSGVMLGLLVWAALRRPTGDRASAVGTAALLMGGLVVLSPVVHLSPPCGSPGSPSRHWSRSA
ncbi:MAG: hypothetical protein ACPF9W_11615, partial [Nocardioides sp.]